MNGQPVSMRQRSLSVSLFRLILTWCCRFGMAAAAVAAQADNTLAAPSFQQAPAAAAPGAGAPVPKTACTSQSAADVLQAVQSSESPIHQVQIASRLEWLPIGRTAELLASVAWDENRRLRVVLSPLEGNSPPAALIESPWIRSVPATKGPAGTDFLQTEPAIDKTLLYFTPRWQGKFRYWQPANVLVIGCGIQGKVEFYARLDTTLTDPLVCAALTLFLCFALYTAAASLTYYMHSDQRRGKNRADNALPGTNYASMFEHFNPVVMTADDNGLGSPAKLQVLFFTIVVFGVVSFQFMATHQLSELSTSVLSLMGISGAGAALSKATDVSKMRLKFDNWAWLVQRKWLPEGGPAEVNRARWKDVITEGGEFNVYRFQMLAFSALVGVAHLVSTAGLSSFAIPDTLLVILGSSQAIYVGGKLAASPAVVNLNTQIDLLRDKEIALLRALYGEGAQKNEADTPGLPLVLSELPKRVGKCWGEYVDTWEQTRKMFESALVREVTIIAQRHRPPFCYVCPPTQAIDLLRDRFDKTKLAHSLLYDRRLRAQAIFGPGDELALLDDLFDKQRMQYESEEPIAKRLLREYESVKISPEQEEELLIQDKTVQEEKVNKEEHAYDPLRDALERLHRRITTMQELNDKIEQRLKEELHPSVSAL